VGQESWSNVTAEPNGYVPRPNDSVILEHSDNRLIVIHVDASRRRAALKTITGPVILYENVPWSKLSLSLVR
jgi:hypothetical protein